MQIECIDLDSLAPNRRTHSSQVAVERRRETVHPSNPPASAAWDAASGTTSLTEVALSPERMFGVTVTEEMAAMAIRQLRERKLVATAGVPLLSTVVRCWPD